MRIKSWCWLSMAFCVVTFVPRGNAVTTVFFDPGQIATPWASGATSETIRSNGYQFTYTVDKYWSPVQGGEPTGRFFVVTWPDGVQSQAVTAGPSTGHSQIEITRVDGEVFDISQLTFQILANTGGAGATLEVMPLLNGEDAFPDPLMLNATGYYSQSFAYGTPTLHGYDTYKFSLYVDFALTQLTLIDASVPEPATLSLAGVSIVLLLNRRAK